MGSSKIREFIDLNVSRVNNAVARILYRVLEGWPPWGLTPWISQPLRAQCCMDFIYLFYLKYRQ